MTVDWKLVIAALAFCAQAVAVVGTVTAGNTKTQTDIAEIRAAQVSTSAKVDVLYNRFVGAGLDQVFGRGQ